MAKASKYVKDKKLRKQYFARVRSVHAYWTRVAKSLKPTPKLLADPCCSQAILGTTKDFDGTYTFAYSLSLLECVVANHVMYLDSYEFDSLGELDSIAVDLVEENILSINHGVTIVDTRQPNV